MNKNKVFFENVNGKQIFCILSEPQASSNKIVIMSHGFRGSSVGPARTFVDFTKILTENGYSVLRFDQPNSGNSEGDYINSSFNEWVDTTAYFAKKYLNEGYKVSLLGQSMGATTTMAVTSKKELKDKIPFIILWVPDPETDFDKPANVVYEEDGQKYKGTFWKEAKKTNFFKCLDEYKGAIHLVYGEEDRYVSKGLREEVIRTIKNKNQEVMILSKQNHSPWEFDICQSVYKKELEFIKRNL